MNKKTVYIFASGEFSKKALFLLSDDCDEKTVICVDGGLRHYEALKEDKSFSKTMLHKKLIDRSPDLIIGDFDSSPYSFEEVSAKYTDSKVVRLQSEKDETDMEHAIMAAIDESPDEIVMLGSTGTRLDHTLANATLLFRLADMSIKGTIVDDNNVISALTERLSFEKLSERDGMYVSLVPMSDKVEGITYTGLKYGLRDATLNFSSPRGVSNEFSGGEASIKIMRGKALVIMSRD
jgi:thiamine pyrophosphokinase